MKRDVVIFCSVVVAVVLDRGQPGMDIGRTSGSHHESAAQQQKNRDAQKGHRRERTRKRRTPARLKGGGVAVKRYVAGLCPQNKFGTDTVVLKISTLAPIY